jgi:hypothetical protein
MKENRNPLPIINRHTNIQQNKKVFTQNMWKDLAGPMKYINNINITLFSNKGSEIQLKSRGQNGMKSYHNLEMLTKYAT